MRRALDPGLEENAALAHALDETAEVLDSQGGNPFRVRAYRAAAGELRGLEEPVRELWQHEGRAGLQALPHVGESIAKAIEGWLASGVLGILVRLRGDEAAEQVLQSVAGIGPRLAHQIHQDLHVTSLVQLEDALEDGRLAALPGIGPRRLQAIGDQLQVRLRRGSNVQAFASSDVARPSIAELLDVDREYRSRAGSGALPCIAPKRHNPRHEAWLPILHTHRGGHHYTVLFSNTARAHELGRTLDWVIIYLDDGGAEHQWTVVTETCGHLAGKRVVRGREAECASRETTADPVWQTVVTRGDGL